MPHPSLSPEAIPPAVMDVVGRLRELGHHTFVVGGCVRDLLRGVPPKDFDVATAARPEEVQRAFRKVIPTGIEHGTVTVLSRGLPVEVTTFRSEGEYKDGRRPERVTFERDIVLDLSRRDFTINAMAYDPVAGELVDPFEGQRDLGAHVIRCVGDAHARFSEDGLRPLRAVRFAAVLGFALEDATHAAIPRTLDVFRKVSAERVRDEFVKLLLAPGAREGLELLGETRLRAEFLPELERAPAAELALAHRAVVEAPATLEVRLALLLGDAAGPDAVRAVAQRLKLPNRAIERAHVLARHRDLSALHGAPDARLRRFCAELGLEPLPELLELARARVAVRAPAELPALHALSERLRALLAAPPPLSTRELALDGAAIMRVLGTGPGPQVGKATRFLLDQVLEDPARNTAEALEALLRAWAARAPGPAGV